MDFAVVGMGCVLPGSPGIAEWLERGRSGVSAIGALPEGRWVVGRPPLDPEPGRPDHVVTAAYGAVPATERPGPDPLFAQVEHVCREALGESAGARTDIVLANLSLASTGAIRAASGPWRSRVHAPGLAGGTALDLEQSAGPAERAAVALGLDGAAVALDAACASGLYAVRLACDRLAARQADQVLAAGVNRADPTFLMLGFSQLRALSPSGVARPLDRRADGLVVGEGAAAVRLKRLADAVRDGDRIHAVIRGCGLGNDGRKGNLLAPDSDGQLRAMRAAHARARLAPEAIGYVECHATGTSLGDGAEVQALAALHADRSSPLVLASTKGVLGHTITVAGLAGLIRAVGAVRDGWLPPMPGCEPLDGIDGRRLRVLGQAEAWRAGTRRAGVSAFGFGGTNAHVLVEQFEQSAALPPPALLEGSPRLAVVGIAGRIGSADGIDALSAALLDGASLLAPAPPEVHRGLVTLPDGAWVDAVEVCASRFRIPPTELAEVLPQQAAWLRAAADAFAQVPGLDPHRTGAVVGMGIDLHVAEAVIRQTCADPAVRDAVCPPLTPGRVQGVLPNFVANRVAAALDLRGPSYTVSAGASSGQAALDHARRMLACGEVDAVVVGASDFRYLGAVRGDGAVGEGAIAFVVVPETRAEAPLAVLDPDALPEGDEHHAVVGDCGALDGLVPVLAHVLGNIRAQGRSLPAAPAPLHPVRIAHSGPVVRVPAPAWRGRWGEDTVPVPAPRMPGERSGTVRFSGHARPAMVPLDWGRWTRARPAPADVQAERVALPATPAPRAGTPPPRIPGGARAGRAQLASRLLGTSQLARSMANATMATAEAHEAFLAEQERTTAGIAALADQLDRAAGLLAAKRRGGAAARPPKRRRPPPSPPARAPARGPRPVSGPPRALSREALERFASGPLSDVLGPEYADLDGISPRVRLPMGPLLLVSRVVAVEGTPRKLGQSRIVTEFDLAPDAEWAHDGKPPPAVVVESGQADLFLCAFLGTDAVCRGERLYRLLDCDLTFHCDRPPVGETLRHDIRIHRFARLGDTLLFYFEYDCTLKRDGTPVLTMRDGCAGFFTHAELARPQGVSEAPADRPPAAPLRPHIAGAPGSLDADAVRALGEARYADAFGPAFAAADGSALRLPPGRWGLLDRVPALSVAGGPHGLGGVVAEQDLRDDDWFNPVHFKDDPCMPGTLMFDGCVQALQVWLMAHGFPAAYREATFEPVPDITARLRCRGQVAPGHARLVYDVRVTGAGLDPTPWAVADVVLRVDGTPVVRAEDVSVRIQPATSTASAIALPTEAGLLELAVGLPSRAFGPAMAAFDGARRTPRIPGPPLATMSRVTRADGPALEPASGRALDAAYDVPASAWYFDADPGAPMPLGVLMEVALQPCGWFTAWQGCALALGGDPYFRNLEGDARIRGPVGCDAGTLHTRATVTTLARTGGMLLNGFSLEVRDDRGALFTGTTRFGYFQPAALADQKGLTLGDETQRVAWRADATGETAVVDTPRADLRMLDRVTVVAPDGGPAGLGYYEAVKAVDPAEWFFTAHFRDDPVMPGSLGVEGMAQLAAWVLRRHLGDPDARIGIAPDVHLVWKYRGQVVREREQVTVELCVTGVSGERLEASAVLRVDGLPIYAVEGLAVAVYAPEPVTEEVPAPRSAAAALLDTFEVHGDSATGTLRLDPARHPWLRDHCPTLVIPALPMAFAVEIAAEAATLLRPGRTVAAVPEVRAERWVLAETPTELLVVAVADGDTVAVTLAVHHHNERFPKLSGPRVHMRAVVELADRWAPAPPAPRALTAAAPVDLSAADYYAGGATFHGPVLHALIDLGVRGPSGARAVLHTRPDATLLPPGSPAFVLDPLLLDGATHPMMSGTAEVWGEAVGTGRLAYPVACDELRFHGPRPQGEVGCRLDVVEATAERLVFDVRLTGSEGVWATFRWSEALVPAGPLLAPEPALVARFCKRREPAEVRIGRPEHDGWRVGPEDLAEPLPGTVERLMCHPAEVGGGHLAERLAVREAVRSHLRAVLRDVHPSAIRLVRLDDTRWVVAEVVGLTAQEAIDAVGPTRFAIRVVQDGDAAIARVVPAS